jgi:ribonuclease BN (tRNA processing enzyme)
MLIKVVLICHSNIYHLKGLFPIFDVLVMMGTYSFELISIAEILASITDNLFNDLIWPDFTSIPSERRAIMKLREIETDSSSLVGGLSVQPVPVSHTVACVGYIVKEVDKGFMYTADTGTTERFWEIAREEQGIELIIADVSFPNRLEKLAARSGHMTLSMLVKCLERFNLGHMKVFITHMKPIFLREILSDLTQLNNPKVGPLRQGSILTL